MLGCARASDTLRLEARDEVAVGTRCLFDPGANIDVGTQTADLGDCEPAAHGVLGPREAHPPYSLRAHVADPVRALAEALRVADEAVAAAGLQAGLLVGLANRRAQQVRIIAVLGVPLCEAPDTRATATQEEESDAAIRAHQDDASTGAARRSGKRVRDSHSVS